MHTAYFAKKAVSKRIPLILLKTENNKKIIVITIHTWKYCSYVWLHYSCPMNNAIGIG